MEPKENSIGITNLDTTFLSIVNKLEKADLKLMDRMNLGVALSNLKDWRKYVFHGQSEIRGVIDLLHFDREINEAQPWISVKGQSLLLSAVGLNLTPGEVEKRLTQNMRQAETDSSGHITIPLFNTGGKQYFPDPAGIYLQVNRYDYLDGKPKSGNWEMRFSPKFTKQLV